MVRGVNRVVSDGSRGCSTCSVEQRSEPFKKCESAGRALSP